jgi:hypothetical protein
MSIFILYFRPMNIRVASLLFVLFSSLYALGQGDNVHLLAQSPDGHTVKLVWSMNSLPAGFTGFEIRRKDGIGDWHTLNKVALLPGISQKKDLSPFESDNAEATRIREKLRDMLSAGKLKEYDFSVFSEKWSARDKDVLDVLQMASVNFDIAVISGFGFVDHSVIQKMEYQYGLFLKGGDKPIAKTKWNFGAIPDLDAVKEITSKALRSSRGIQLLWTADLARVRSGYVSGFNVYKRGIRLNDRPIQPSGGKEKAEYTFTDAGADPGVADQYSISAESLFGIEGNIRTYEYDPADHPKEYVKPVVTKITSLGFYFKEGIEVKWTYPKDQERFIKGFVVEKDNMPAGYTAVSDVLPEDARIFVDETSSPVSSALRIRVNAVYWDKTVVNGAELLYSYFPLLDPPRPINTKAVVGGDARKPAVKITWDPIINGDSVTRNYHVYMYPAAGGKVEALNDKVPVRQSSFSYPIPRGSSSVLRFYVVAEGRSGGFSNPGDTVQVVTPTTVMPAVTVTKAVAEGNDAVVQWHFGDVSDLAGFRISDGSTLVADEKVLTAGVRYYTIKGAASAGAEHNYTVRAVSASGVISEDAVSMQVVFPPAKK